MSESQENLTPQKQTKKWLPHAFWSLAGLCWFALWVQFPFMGMVVSVFILIYAGAFRWIPSFQSKISRLLRIKKLRSARYWAVSLFSFHIFLSVVLFNFWNIDSKNVSQTAVQQSKVKTLISNAEKEIKNENISDAKKILIEALRFHKAPQYAKAKQLYAHARKATSENYAMKFLLNLSEENFTQFEETQISPNTLFENDHLNKLFNTLLVKNLEYAKYQRRSLAAQEKLERNIGRRPANARSDGSVGAITRFLEKNLKDPESVEFLSWHKPVLVERKGERFWGVRVRYKAKNEIGSFVNEEGMGLIRHGKVITWER